MRSNADDEEEVLPSYSNHPLTNHSENSSSSSNAKEQSTPTFEDDCPFTLDNLRHWIYLSLGLIIGLLLIIDISARGKSSTDSCSTSSSTSSTTFTASNLVPISSTKESDPFLSYYKVKGDSSNIIYAKLSKALVDKEVPLLFVEQVTKGVGLVDVFWDPADIIAQDEVKFRLDSSLRRVLLYTRQNHFRGDKYLMQESFAESILGSYLILKSDADSYWIDFSSFIHANAGIVHGNDLSSTIFTVYGSEYCYAHNADLSNLNYGLIKSNGYRSTYESVLTYSVCNKQGASLPLKYFDQVLASSTHLTISIRRTFLKLRPFTSDVRGIVNNDDDGYASSGLSTYYPRWFHPKSGFNAITYRDEDKSLWSSRLTSYIVRFDLKFNKKIAFYVDLNIPEPYSAAIKEGIMWWDDAFQYAGYKPGTMVVQSAPLDMDPYDFYEDGRSFVHWIDRDVRYYSIGLRVVDPRTGEIIKGHVRLEGLRLRQDALIAQALLDKSTYTSELQRKDDIFSCVLQRVRHLGAHEVGHALGLAHNFAGSTSSSGYASVMDYPPPIIQMKDGVLRLNEGSYSNGIGVFDKISIKYGYGQFSSDRLDVEQQQLTDFIAYAEKSLGYTFLTDENSADSAVDWRDTKWDVGMNPVKSLGDSMGVRKVALNSLSLQSFVDNNIPTSRLLELFPLVYLWHRYEIEATTKLLGGRNISYAMRADVANQASAGFNFVKASLQKQAIHQLATALMPSEVAVPQSIIQLSLAASFGYSVDVGSNGDLFVGRFGEGLLDPASVYDVYGQMIFSNIFSVPRLERLAYQHLLDSSYPGIEDISTHLYGHLFNQTIAMKAVCQNTLLESFAIQSRFVNTMVKLHTSFRNQMSALAQKGVEAAKYKIQNQLNTVIRQGSEFFCPPDVFCSNCASNAQVYLDHLQFLVTKLLASTEFLVDSPVPIGPPL